MKKLFIVLLIVGLLIPAVSAEIILDEEFEEYEFTGGTRYSDVTHDGITSYEYAIDTIRFADITRHSDVTYITLEIKHNNKLGHLEEGRTVRTYTLGGRQDTAVVYVEHMRNLLGQTTSTVFRIFPQNWNNVGLSGEQQMVISPSLATIRAYGGNDWVNDLAWPCNSERNILAARTQGYYGYSIVVSSINEWKNHLTVKSVDNGQSYQIDLKREYDTKSYFSKIALKYDDTIILSEYDNTDFSHITLKSQINGISITTPTSTTYNRTIVISDTPEPDAIPINIRVLNSQTGALIANAHISISANVNGTFYEVVNETLPAGTKTYNLQPTGGGLPNPDFYRLIVTAEGYNSIMPYSDFEADIATTIYAYMNPIGGAPVDENKTFIDFYVRDLNAKPVAGATVKFGDYTLITNNAGYTIFEVKKDSTYTWTVSKSGYGSVTGNAVIGSDARYTINAVIAPAVTPTLPTPIPTKTPVKPSPTLTSPTGEPVSNMLEWAAAHFGMLLGGGLEIGKIFMWLCFTIPAGVYVGNKAKAGAAGFMAGAGIVTLFFVLIGWVPIWIVVILALIIGLLYARAFSNIGNGGGR